MVGESREVEAAAAAASAASFSESIEGFDEVEWAAIRVRPERSPFGNRVEPGKIRLNDDPIRPANNRVLTGFWQKRIGMRTADIALPEKKSKYPVKRKWKNTEKNPFQLIWIASKS